MNERAFHIDFKDGSNPYYHFACPVEERRKALRRWKRKYSLKLVASIEGIEFYEAEEK